MYGNETSDGYAARLLFIGRTKKLFESPLVVLSGMYGGYGDELAVCDLTATL